MDAKLLFFLLAGLIGAIVVFASGNPIRILIMMVAVFYIFPVGWIFYQYTGLLLVDAPILAVLGFALITGKRVRFYFKELTPSFLILIAWMLVTSLRAPEPGWGISEISKWVRGYLIFICAANFIKSEKELRLFVFAILAGFAIEVFIGMHQWRIGNVGLAFLGERPWRPEFWRAYGTFYVPSFFGDFLIMILPILLRLLIFYKPAKKWETYLYGFLTATGFATLYATLARGPWLSFIAVVAIMFLFTFVKSKLRPKLKWPIFVGILFGVAFTVKYLPKIILQFGEERKTAAMSRVYLGQVALRVFEDNMLFGVGLANYELRSSRYVVPIPEYPAVLLAERVHNSYLLMLAENGIPGGLAFLFLLIQFFIICFRLFRANNKFILNIAVGGFMALLALCISFVASPDIHHDQTISQMFLIVGLVFAGELIERRHAITVRRMQIRQRRDAKLAPNSPPNGVAAPVSFGHDDRNVQHGGRPPERRL